MGACHSKGSATHSTKGRNAAGGKASGNEKQISGDVSFAEIVNASPHSISFSKVVTILPDGYRPETGRKGDLGQLIDKYNINDVVIHMYRDRSGANDLQRMKDLGFEIQAQSLGTAQPGSALPPRDYYYMIRTRKLTPTTDNSSKTKSKARKAKRETKDNELISVGTTREQRRIARVSRQQTRAQKYGRPKGAQ